MEDAVIVSAIRTPIGTAFRGTLTETPAETLATFVLGEAVKSAAIDPNSVDDVIFGETGNAGSCLARYAAVANGMEKAPGQAVQRWCASGLVAVSSAAATIQAGMDKVVVAGGVHSSSTGPKTSWRVMGTTDEFFEGSKGTFPFTEDANDDVTLTVGWNVAQLAGLSREDMDRWAWRSHMRAAQAIVDGKFDAEIRPITVKTLDGQTVTFAVDEHPRAGSTLEKLASLKPLHPEIENFSITAGNAAGVNDAASALVLTSRSYAEANGLTPLARVRGWAAEGVAPRLTGMGAIAAAEKLLHRTGLGADQIDIWEINEAFASVSVAACKLIGIDEEKVNIYGSGCSLGHPIAASGARMVTTMVHELQRRGGGIGLASMCAAGGQGGALVIEVE